MATQKNTVHSVGNINSSQIRTIPYVFAKEDLENYSLVKLAYNGDKQEADYATAEGDDVYLLAAVEVMYDDESVQEFYVGKGEGGRIVHLEKGVRFETTNFLPITGTAPARGQFASWDGAKKKFQLSAAKPATPVGGKVLQVVNVGSGEYGFGETMVRFTVL